MDFVLIIGGNSDIGKAIAKEYAKKSFNLYLTHRNEKQLDEFCASLENRYGIKVFSVFLDVLDFNSHLAFYNALDPKPKGIVSTVGLLDDNDKSFKNFNSSLLSINTNYVGLVSLLNIASNQLIKDKARGFIIGVSSVAGERGRKSNFIYGSAKSGFTEYLSGLRSYLNPYGIKVLTILPGFVYTKMTEGLKLPRLLSTNPKLVAKKIVQAQSRQKDVIYISWFWKYIMIVIKILPEKIFKKINF
tara:strand:- start:367 stop:1101 length:735 start_codon:yes stop_codon:yes gene_type:complete